MKKLLALVIALAMVLSLATVLVSAEDEPDAYLVLMTDGEGTEPSITYTVSGEKLTGPVSIEALVYFSEDCASNPDGSVYLNIYPWDASGNLLHWTDYAKHNSVTPGEWTVVTLENWDCSKGGVDPDYATLTAGIWHAVGTLKVAYIKASVGGEVIFEVNYAEGFDLSAASGSAGIADDTKGVKWDYIAPAAEESTPAEESKPVTPTTGDAGIIALAVVSVLALGGAVIVKKSK